MRNISSRININKCRGSRSDTDMMQKYEKNKEEKKYKIFMKTCIQKDSKEFKSMQKHAHMFKSARKVLGKNWESTRKVLGMYQLGMYW